MSLGSDYEAAVKSGNTPLANYLAKGLASAAGINVNENDVEAAPASMLPTTSPLSPTGASGLPSLAQAGDALFQGIIHPLDSLTGTNSAAMNAQITSGNGAVTNAAASVTNAVSGATGALSFITNIPRVATTLLGLILLIAGIFALTKGPAVNIITNAAKAAAVS